MACYLFYFFCYCIWKSYGTCEKHWKTLQIVYRLIGWNLLVFLQFAIWIVCGAKTKKNAACFQAFAKPKAEIAGLKLLFGICEKWWAGRGPCTIIKALRWPSLQHAKSQGARNQDLNPNPSHKNLCLGCDSSAPMPNRSNLQLACPKQAINTAF